MNECWQGDACLCFGRPVTFMEERERERQRWRRKERKGVKEKEGTSLKGEQLLKRSNTGEDDTLTSCTRCHSYQLPVCHRFLAFSPFFFFWSEVLVFERKRERDTKGGRDEQRREGKGGYRIDG